MSSISNKIRRCILPLAPAAKVHTATAAYQATISADFIGNKNERKRMRKFTMLSLIALFMANAGVAETYDHEVFKSGSKYYYKTDGKVRGDTTDLAMAIQNAIGSGNRTVYLRTGGTLSRTVNLASDLTINGLGNTLEKSGFNGSNKDDIKLYNLTLNGGGQIQFSGCNNVTCEEVSVKNGGAGIRVDSHAKSPWSGWVKNFKAINCSFENLRSHGLETYSVDGYSISGITAKNMGKCGVLMNRSKGGTIDTVKADRCDKSGGYAGLRFANSCDGATVKKLISKECGRGFFTCSSSRNITVDYVDIADCRQGILIQTGVNVKVKRGVVRNSKDNKGRSVITQNSPGSDARVRIS